MNSKTSGKARATASDSKTTATATGGGGGESFLPLLARDSPSATLAALLACDLPTFFSTHWERAPLHVARRNPSFYSGLFSKSLVDAHVRRNAAGLQYGFDLNLCVCSDEGKKVDMNPRKPKAGAKPAQKQTSASAAAVTNSSGGSRKGKGGQAAAAASASEADGEETMSIADALRLAEQQKRTLGKGRAQQEEEEEEEEEEGSGSAASESDEEELLDGTSVSTIREYAPVTFADYDRLYRDGCTVQALQPQHYHAPMTQLITQLERLFGGLVGANCYLTPPRSQGLAPHYDDVEVFVLQLEGTKAWRLYHPSRSLPREHSGDFAREEIGEPFQELELQPGDLMFLPRGCIHEARTSDLGSAHMTISVYQKTAFFDFLSQLFPIALQAAFDSDETEAFRKGLPLNYLSYCGSAGKLADELREKGMPIDDSEKTADGEPISAAEPTRTRSQLREGMKAQVRSLLTQLQPILESHIDACADEMSRDFMQSRLPPLDAASSSAAPAAAASSSSNNPFQLSSGGALGAPPQPTSLVRLRHPSAVRMIVMPGNDEEEAEADEEEEDEEEEGGFGGAPHLLLTHSLHNETSHHLDGRHPPDLEALAAAQISLPMYYAPALLQLLRARQPLPLSSLQLDLGDMLNADGDAPSESEQMSARMELAVSLWQARLLEVVDSATKASSAGATGKKMKRPAAAEPPPAAHRRQHATSARAPPNKKQRK